MTTPSQQGLLRRILRIIGDRTTIVVPVDDAGIVGPRKALRKPRELNEICASARVDAMLALPGWYRVPTPAGVGRIVNLTLSTIRASHTRKKLVSTVDDALRLDADAVAVHVNFGSRYESEMLEILGAVCVRAHEWGIPVLAIAYPRGESPDGTDNNFEDLRNSDPVAYNAMIAHVARAAVEVGADLIKTRYSADGLFHEVVQCVSPTPVLVAGGSYHNPINALLLAQSALSEGAAGISFGRAVHQANDVRRVLTVLAAFIHGEMTFFDAEQILRNNGEDMS